MIQFIVIPNFTESSKASKTGSAVRRNWHRYHQNKRRDAGDGGRTYDVMSKWFARKATRGGSDVRYSKRNGLVGNRPYAGFGRARADDHLTTAGHMRRNWKHYYGDSSMGKDVAKRAVARRIAASKDASKGAKKLP